MEPIHDLQARTTATSQAEGRLKVSIAGMMKKNKRKILKKKLRKY